MALQSGDMVMLVWACCAKGRARIGWTGIIEGFYEVTEGESKCYCGQGTRGMHAWVNIVGPGIVPVSWLKKIEPPTTEKTKGILVSGRA